MDRFTIEISDNDIADLKRRLAATRFPETVRDAGWDYGMDADFLRRLVRYWHDQYDWRAEEKRLNRFGQFTTQIDGQKVHFVHEKGRGGKTTPLLLLNGWPSNFVEYLPLIERLTTEQDGQSFDVVVPSLIGFGFSPGSTEKGMTLSRMARLFGKLMSELGYQRFLISGSDLGAGVELGLIHQAPERVIGAHYANVYSRYPRPEKPSAAEQAYFKIIDQWVFTEAAYAMEQGTKPMTLAVGLNDSPAGLAAWILEKFHRWSDHGGNLEEVFSLDVLCTILSVYWFTQSIGSSVRLYKEVQSDADILQPLHGHSVPQGVLVPAECDLPAPKEWGERHLDNLIQWSEPKKGGHFPALEIPDIMDEDIRKFARAADGFARS
jgi:pimeloyl-ACP methyl ester carboxylesterase